MTSIERRKELNPKTTTYEFFGPFGALLITIGAPLVTYALYLTCSEESGGCPPNGLAMRTALQNMAQQGWWMSVWDTEAMLVYLGFYAFCVVAWAVLPGRIVEGVPLRTGGAKKYKINGLATFICALCIAIAVIAIRGPESFTFFYDHWIGIITATIFMSVLQSLACYLHSFLPSKLLALGGNTGNPIYDFFIGRELNPSIGSFDLKSFNELRPGLILWVLIDISMACAQATRRGGLAKVTDSMWLVVFFQVWYVGDSLYNESAVFTTIDIISDGLGFMLCFGCITWIPCTFSLQARYLVFAPLELGPVNTSLILLVNVTGYHIFRSANNEKNDFRNGGNTRNLKYIHTAQGSKLITSGWWGRSRHPNYLGDIIMAFAWSLPTGFNTPITYFYVTYFVILLIHRERRDDDKCAGKYGADWKTYKRIVPYRILPLVY
ncbi:hypothetical protein HGRIS_003492 [Hohenbuehelia grisea]|uniref:ERG4/ERG24 ergosterol biosynthesis protein n=1 Tax=Hohenbuehelia grisea TaxID=104357 RepID=A0ABR3JGF1_9AGAR